jgi:hypothetical protein
LIDYSAGTGEPFRLLLGLSVLHEEHLENHLIANRAVGYSNGIVIEGFIVVLGV